MERVEFIAHNGANILRVDVSNTTSAEENLEVLDKARAMVRTRPPKSVLFLTVVTGAFFNVKSIEELKKWSNSNTPLVKASAVVGVVGIYRFMYEAVVKLTGRDIVCFDTEEEALDWLASR